MFDRTTQGRRPTGTAFKPFVYATAFEGGYFPGTLIDDTPMDARKVMIGGTTGILGEWGPESFENTYENRITARRALAKSKNSASVRLGQKVGNAKVVNLASRAGMRFEGDLQKFNATFLGRNPSSLDELCLAYTIFPNNGRLAEKSFIISNIEDSTGNLIYTPQVSMREGQVIDRYTAYQINSILNDSFAYGTAKKARDEYGLDEFPVAGKTGTEYDFTDNWFVGYTSEVTCIVWAGFDSTSTIYPGAFSSDTVLPVWTQVMNEAAKEFEPRPFLPPADAEQVEICLKSGQLASDRCYELVTKANGITSQVRTTYIEFLRPGTNIETVCVLHGGKRRNLTEPQRTSDGLIRPQIVVAASAEPVLPIGPTIIGTEDPYKSISPVIRARVAVEPEKEEPEADAGAEGGAIRAMPVDGNGIPVARPAIIATPEVEVPDNRVVLPPPRPIEFE